MTPSGGIPTEEDPDCAPHASVGSAVAAFGSAAGVVVIADVVVVEFEVEGSVQLGIVAIEGAQAGN